MLDKIGIPKNSTKFTGQHLSPAWNFNEKEILAHAFSFKFLEFFKNIFFVKLFRGTNPD